MTEKWGEGGREGEERERREEREGGERERERERAGMYRDKFTNDTAHIYNSLTCNVQATCSCKELTHKEARHCQWLIP